MDVEEKKRDRKKIDKWQVNIKKVNREKGLEFVDKQDVKEGRYVCENCKTSNKHWRKM